jgi:hypothetical protein
MNMKPLSLNDNMLIPSNALKSKIVFNPSEFQKIQEDFKKKMKPKEVEGGEEIIPLVNEKPTDNLIFH